MYKLIKKYYRKTANLNKCPFIEGKLVGSCGCSDCRYNKGEFEQVDETFVRCGYLYKQS